MIIERGVSYGYFIQDRDSREIKIGYSRNLVLRLKHLRREYQRPSLSLLGVIPGGRREEILHHHQFRDLCVKGEWFRPEESLLSYIRENAIEARLPERPKPAKRPRRKDPRPRVQLNIKVQPFLFQALDDLCRSEGFRKGFFLQRMLERALAEARPLHLPAGEELLASASAGGHGSENRETAGSRTARTSAVGGIRSPDVRLPGGTRASSQ